MSSTEIEPVEAAERHEPVGIGLDELVALLHGLLDDDLRGLDAAPQEIAVRLHGRTDEEERRHDRGEREPMAALQPPVRATPREQRDQRERHHRARGDGLSEADERGREHEPAEPREARRRSGSPTTRPQT